MMSLHVAVMRTVIVVFVLLLDHVGLTATSKWSSFFFFLGHFPVCSHCNVGQLCVSHRTSVKMLIIKSVDHRDKTLKNSQKNIFQENFGKIACRQPEHFTASRMGPLCPVYSLQWSICQKAESISCSALQSLEVEAECSRHT